MSKSGRTTRSTSRFLTSHASRFSGVRDASERRNTCEKKRVSALLPRLKTGVSAPRGFYDQLDVVVPKVATITCHLADDSFFGGTPPAADRDGPRVLDEQNAPALGTLGRVVRR